MESEEVVSPYCSPSCSSSWLYDIQVKPKMDVHAAWMVIHSDVCGISKNQSASISINQFQSELISINQHVIHMDLKKSKFFLRMFSSYSDPDLDWMFSSHSTAKLKPERSSEEIRQCKHWLREVYPFKNIALSKISIKLSN